MLTQAELQKELDLRWNGRIQVKYNDERRWYELWERKDGRDLLLTPLMDRSGRGMPLSRQVVDMVHKYASLYNVRSKQEFLAKAKAGLEEKYAAMETAGHKRIEEATDIAKPYLNWMTKNTVFATRGNHGTGHRERERAWGKMGRDQRGLKS